MPAPYEPEMGQAAFGQPPQAFECPTHVEKALRVLSERWYALRPTNDNPFANTGAAYHTDGLAIAAYSWSEDDQPWNFQWQDIEVSWYKYLGRGMSINRDVSEEETTAMLEACLPLLTELRSKWEEP